ncbi:hypothetical protein SESBI_13762 [Sesbania bispinosa]|nr:hypothetical protein SESBI_13762 [Sesbania bispinosa]
MASPPDANMEPEPPDGAPHHKDKASFKDTLIGKKDSSHQHTKVDLIGNQLFRIEYEEDSTQPMSDKDVQHQEALHGDWLVVTRTKKGRNKAQSKGPSQQASLGDRNKLSKTTQDPKANQVTSIEFPKTIQAPKSKRVLSAEFPSKNLPGQKEGSQMVFQSVALSTKSSHNGRKKRHKIDLPNKLDSPENTTTLGVKSNNLVKDGGKDPLFGIKTTMNVDILSQNRLRFRDEDDPKMQENPEKDMHGDQDVSMDAGNSLIENE